MTFENAQDAAIRSAVIIAVGALLVVVARWVLGRVVGRLTRAPRAKVEKTGRFTVTLGSVPVDHAALVRRPGRELPQFAETLIQYLVDAARQPV